MGEHFLSEAFYEALDLQRHARSLTWKKVAEEAQVSASSLTRIAQGRRPDVDTMAALCTWGALDANNYLAGNSPKNIQEPLPEILAHLRADKNISTEGANAMIAMLTAGYEQFRAASVGEQKDEV